MLLDQPAVYTYQLDKGGRSEAAAQMLLHFKWRQTTMRGAKGRIIPSGLSEAEEIATKKKFYRDLFDEMRRSMYKAELRAVGLDAPTTVVYTYTAGLPRAYRQLPRLYQHHYTKRFYINSPVDYLGNHFQPKDAKRSPVAHNIDYATGVQARPGNDTKDFSYVMVRDLAGIDLPYGFDPKKHFTQPGPFNPEAEGIAAFMLNADGIALLDRYPLPPNMRACTLPEGVEYLLDAVPEFRAPDHSCPSLCDMEGSSLLLYKHDNSDGAFDFRPPGATRLSEAAYTKMAVDAYDRRNGHVPPPTPESIERELERCDRAIHKATIRWTP